MDSDPPFQEIIVTGPWPEGGVRELTMKRLRRREVVGLAVITARGERLGEVEDLLVNRRGTRVIGFLMGGGSRLLGDRVYPIEEVRAIGEGAVVVSRAGVLLRTRRSRPLRRLLAGNADLVGKRLVTDQGQDLGVIADLVFEPDTGAVLGYELSGGFIRDITEGKGFIPATAGMNVGKDVVVWKGGVSQ